MAKSTMNKKLSSSLSFNDARNFSCLSIEEKEAFVATLTDAEAAQLRYMWEAWARDNQLPPRGHWVTWLNMGGRGSGKTRAGAEWIRKKKDTSPFLHLIGRTAADVRDVMIDGESGILAISPPWDKPNYQRSQRRLVWKNGAQAITFSADEPESLRGPQCFGLWADEPGAWQYADEAYDMASFGLRLGDNPQACLTTTPRVTKLIKRLVSSPNTKISRSTVYDNRANLAETFFSEIIRRFEGTRLGRQELLGQLIEDNENALWNRETMIEAYRVTKAPDLIRVGVAIDPAVTSGEDSDETGMIVGGIGSDGHGYILADASLRASPMKWASESVAMYHKFRADRMVAEGNQGGELIETTVRTVDKTISFKRVHAKRGKYTRAEPVASLYERGMVHHVGIFSLLEDEMCQWEQGDAASPNRLDALVWLLTELMLGGGIPGYVLTKDLIERAAAKATVKDKVQQRNDWYW